MADWAPLEQVAEVTARSAVLPSISPGSFMYMGRLEGADRPALHLYYYEELPDLRTALDRLDLHLDNWSPLAEGEAAKPQSRRGVIVPHQPRRRRPRHRPDCA